VLGSCSGTGYEETDRPRSHPADRTVAGKPGGILSRLHSLSLRAADPGGLHHGPYSMPAEYRKNKRPCYDSLWDHPQITRGPVPPDGPRTRGNILRRSDKGGCAPGAGARNQTRQHETSSFTCTVKCRCKRACFNNILAFAPWDTGTSTTWVRSCNNRQASKTPPPHAGKTEVFVSTGWRGVARRVTPLAEIGDSGALVSE
jgi:hypothetical protein